MAHDIPEVTTWTTPRLRLMTNVSRAEGGASTYSVESGASDFTYAPAS